MTKQEAEKELLTVITDILNPYNTREVEIEAWSLAEDGWRRVARAEWVDTGFDDYYKCSNCGYIQCDKEQLRLNPQHFLYCGHCGAEIIKRRTNNESKN